MLPTQTYHRIFKWTLGLLALLGLVLVGLPFAIQLGIERGLVRLGADQVTVKDVDFNPFVGRLVVEGLQARTGEAAPLSLEELRVQLAWWPLWNKHVVVEDLLVRGLQLGVSQATDAQPQIAGLMLPAGEAEEDQVTGESAATDQVWGFGIRHFQLEASDVRYHTESLDVALRIDAFALSRLLSFAEAVPVSASFEGAINDAPLSMAFWGTPFSEPRTVKGSISLQAFELAGLNKMLSPAINELKGRLTINVEMEAQQHAQGDLKLNVKGNTNLAELGLQMPEQKIALNHETVAWQGEVNLQQQAQKISWQVDGDIASTHSAVFQLIKDKPIPLFSAAAIDINGIHVSSIPRASAPPDMMVGGINLDSFTLRLAKTKAGVLQLPGGAAAQSDSSSSDAHNSATTADQPVAKPVAESKLRLGQFSITGDSAVQFEDESVRPPFNLNLHLSEMLLEGLDNMQPKQPTVLRVAGKLDEFSEIRVDAKLFPFSKKLTLDLLGKISSLDLPPLSCYAEPVLGYNLASGHLDAELSFKVNQGVINSENQLKINQLSLDPSDPDKVAKFSTRLTMPLDAALALLRDKDDNIKLKLPVSGDLDNPKFDIADAINQSLSTAMKYAAMSYIKLALQPFGTLVSIYQVADSAGKMVNAVRLDPVNFEVGKSQLNENATKYLGNTIKLLESRPKLNLKICGKATRADLPLLHKSQNKQKGSQPSATVKTEKTLVEKTLPALTAEEEKLLLKLARDRSLSIKSYLVSQGTVKAKNLFICNPEIDVDAAAVPMAELRI